MVICSNTSFSSERKQKIEIFDRSTDQSKLIECDGTLYVFEIHPSNLGKTFDINKVHGVALNHSMWHSIHGKEMVIQLKDEQIYGKDGFGEFLCKAVSLEVDKKHKVAFRDLIAEARAIENKRPHMTDRIREYERVQNDMNDAYKYAEQEDIRTFIQGCLDNIKDLCGDEADAYYLAVAKNTAKMACVKKAIWENEKDVLAVFGGMLMAYFFSLLDIFSGWVRWINHY
jgi:hypothetical protein